jgi:hypothetical protein
MNPEATREDVMKLDSGAAVVYDKPLKLRLEADSGRERYLDTVALQPGRHAPPCAALK